MMVGVVLTSPLETAPVFVAHGDLVYEEGEWSLSHPHPFGTSVCFHGSALNVLSGEVVLRVFRDALDLALLHKVHVKPYFVMAALISLSDAKSFKETGKAPWPRVAVLVWELEKSTHVCPRTRNRREASTRQSAKAPSVKVMLLALGSRRQAAPLKSPATTSTCSSSITTRIVRINFFPMPRCVAKLLLWRDITMKVFWPLSGCRRKRST